MRSLLFLLPVLLILNSCTKTKEELKICSELAYLPLEMKASDGSIYGYEIDILKKFAEKYNYSISYFEVPWTTAIPALVSKRCDIIASGMTITPERQSVVNFTDPIYAVVDNFLIQNKEEFKNKFKKALDLNKSGIKIGVRQGNEVAHYLKNNFKNAEILEFPNSDSDVINALLNDKVTAIALHSPMAIAASALNKNKLFILPGLIPTGMVHIAYTVRKDARGDTLQKQFHLFFDDFKNTVPYKQIYDYYFNSTDWISH